MSAYLTFDDGPMHTRVNFLLNEGSLGLGLTRFHGQFRVKRSGSVKGVKDGQNEEIPSSAIEVPEEPCRR
jgi:hypothetical protein